MSTAYIPGLEAMALAIEAQGSHPTGQLWRVRFYAVELARRLGWEAAAMETLELAAVLHDAGELAVPQSILANCAHLSPQEFEKMKAHASVGALLAQQAGLPQAVVRMVRSHHERWDGGGYPDGLSQDAIPPGARILAVADCLAGPGASTALQELRAGYGTAFDPCIVDVALGSGQEIENAVSRAMAANSPPAYYGAIAAARREDRVLAQLAGELGNSLSMAETMATLENRLRDLIAYDCLAVFRLQEDQLIPVYVNGEGAEGLCTLAVPCGAGHNGIAAALRQPALNGNPAMAGDVTGLHAAMAIGLEPAEDTGAVLALYRSAQDAFGSEDFRILLSIRARLSAAVGHAFRHERSEQLSAVDPVTGLPNRRAMFLRLDSDLARCRRSRGTLAVLVCEIDGLASAGWQSAAAAGRLCRAIAAGLRQLCREDDYVARMGEGFVLALGGFCERDLPEKLRLIQLLLSSLDSSNRLAPRVGAAYYPDDGADAEDLLACADSRL